MSYNKIIGHFNESGQNVMTKEDLQAVIDAKNHKSLLEVGDNLIITGDTGNNKEYAVSMRIHIGDRGVFFQLYTHQDMEVCVELAEKLNREVPTALPTIINYLQNWSRIILDFDGSVLKPTQVEKFAIGKLIAARRRFDAARKSAGKVIVDEI